MITADDALFHYPMEPDTTWGETNYFGFYIPEINMNCAVYALFRPTLGVVNTVVIMNSKKVLVPWQADYYDHQVHVPIPPNRDLKNYQLASGLSVRALEPNMRWKVDYDDGMGTELHFEYSAMMDPYDIHDPEQDPCVGLGLDGHDWVWGTNYSGGHFDQTGLFEGEVVLRGRRTSFSTVSTIDHSWGPRPERCLTPISWVHAHVGQDLTIHAMLDYDPMAEPGGRLPLRFTHGYVLENGKLSGLKSGGGFSDRDEFLLPQTTELTLVDSRDREWRLRGNALTGVTWPAWPDLTCFNVVHEWDVDGQTGYGEIMDFVSQPQLCAIYDTHAGSR